ncbi:hypothetical protein V5799_000167 [Amblyomma americanum]|uniref:Uncharacterized protein n=1 Tax=Amblyomma americanum TaxID=6943 RepID=A0AAQ4D3U1_AMBAM
MRKKAECGEHYRHRSSLFLTCCDKSARRSPSGPPQDFLSSWQATLEAMRDRLVYPEGYADVYCYNPLWHGVRFNDDTDTLLIPVRDMFMPNFHTSAPGAVNFAGLGALIARGFAQVWTEA